MIHGIYRWSPQSVAYKNSYCLRCAAPRLVVQVRTFDAFHIVFVPVLPLGLRKRWFCSVCENRPHFRYNTIKKLWWAAGTSVPAAAAFTFWSIPPDPAEPSYIWMCRLVMTAAAALAFVFAWRLPFDPSLEEKLETIRPTTDLNCPFCKVRLASSPKWHCPKCKIECADLLPVASNRSYSLGLRRQA